MSSMAASVHYADKSILIWQASLCGRFLPAANAPQIMTERECAVIATIGLPYCQYLCNVDLCYSPCCNSPFEPDGGEPLKRMQANFPHLAFAFAANWIGCGHAHWEHVVTVTRSAKRPFLFTVPDPVPTYIDVASRDGRVVRVVIPDGVAPGSLIRVPSAALTNDDNEAL